MARSVIEDEVVGVFWDIENCSVPSGKPASKVVQKIRSMDFYQRKREMQFMVVCDVTKESSGKFRKSISIHFH